MNTRTAGPLSYNSAVIDYYGQCEIDYRLVWHLNSQLCMHYGFWDETTTRLRQALQRMNLQLTKLASITSTDRVLDAGCGVGGSTIYLAKHVGCQVEGITIAQNQIDSCFENARRAGVAGKTNFSRQDYLNTNFADDSFDVVWAIESVCYAREKQNFLDEAYRILKPGGRLVVADFFGNPIDSDEDRALMNRWTDSWAIDSYELSDHFQRKMARSGFEELRNIDVTKHVEPSIKRLYYCYFPGIVITNLAQAFRIRNRRQTANTKSTLYQYQAWRRGLWSYRFFKGFKPDS